MINRENGSHAPWVFMHRIHHASKWPIFQLTWVVYSWWRFPHPWGRRQWSWCAPPWRARSTVRCVVPTAPGLPCPPTTRCTRLHTTHVEHVLTRLLLAIMNVNCFTEWEGATHCLPSNIIYEYSSIIVWTASMNNNFFSNAYLHTI